jgi:L-ascorbate metabolism protein UlaG (beta-lactamase superfamily)
MKITYYGHSCFLVETAAHRVLIDPFLTGNPVAPVKAGDVSCDFILLSHAHSDHTGDAEGLARAQGATIVANHEIAEHYGAKGLTTHGMNPGGGWNFPFGRVSLTVAFHTSSFDGEKPPVFGGCACGLVLEVEGKRLYHAGDTALFSDMRLIGRHGLDLACLPIGDNYTMGPADALDALDFLKPKLTVPMHYNTWPPIAQDAAKFAADALARGHQVNALAPGDSISL